MLIRTVRLLLPRLPTLTTASKRSNAIEEDEAISVVVVVVGAMDITEDEVHTEVMDIGVVVAEVVETTLVELAALMNRPRTRRESWHGTYIRRGV